MKSFSLSIPYILLPLIISTAAVAQDTTGRLSGKNQDTCSSLISAVSLNANVTSVSSSIHQNTYIYDDFDFSQPFQHNKGGTATHAVNPSDKANTVIIDPYEGSIPIDRRGKFVKNPEMPQAPSPHPQAATLPKGSFTAEAVWNIQGDIVKGHVYLKDHMYRYDMLVNGKRSVQIESVGENVTSRQTLEIQDLAIIVDRKTQKEIAINRVEKTYYESDGLMFSMLYNPIETYYTMSTMYNAVDQGSETIAQIACDKKNLMHGDILVQTAWISKKYDFPVKIITYVHGKENMIFELKNVTETPVDAKVFEIPEGYNKKQP